MSQPVVAADRHLDRLLSEKSIQLIEELHERPKLKENFDVELLRWPKLGSLSYLKPMIEENENSVIEAPGLSENEVSFSQAFEHKRKAISPLVKSNSDHEVTNAMTGEKNALEDSIKLNDFQIELYSLLKSYRDLLYTSESIEKIDDIQQAYVLHVLSHLSNSRSRILSNNKFFGKKTINDKIIQDDPILRDQGYTRARILFLLPFRYSALRLGKRIAKILDSSHEIIHLDRFIKEFGDEDGADSTLRPVVCEGNKPKDYYQTFHGNVDDSFRLGIKLTKRSVKFFSDFYDSDIIIASPLGLKTLITPDEHSATNVISEDDEQPTYDKDFLSSIEILILDQAEIFLMQNWEHLIDIMQQVNVMPSKPRKMDISRIRLWHLEDLSKYYRQLIMFTSITVPLVHSFFQTYSLNYEGYLAFKHRVEHPQARLIKTKCTQHFLYYNSPNAKDSCDNRFSFFIKQVLPKYTGLGSNATNSNQNCDTGSANLGPLEHTLIFVSSYFDYVRLRNYFRREKLSFTQICEYTEDNKTSKARQLFYFGARQFLIYTERCHFYHRYKIKGVRNIIFYEPPMFPKFYTEMLELLTPELQGKKYDERSAAQFTATTLFSDHSTLQLGAIMGFNNAVKLIQNKKSVT